MAENYWKSVFAGAWDKTYKPLGWDRNKAAVVLIAVGAIGAAFFQLGWAAMITSVTGYLWIAAPAVFAAFILFGWGIIETQANLYATLAQTSSATIVELESTLANSKEPAPDYVAWRHVDLLNIRQAAFLWCELSPRISMPPKVQAWSNALGSAVRKGELSFEVQHSYYGHADTERAAQKKNPHPETIVKRIALQAWAKQHDYDPIFLRDA
jgi:hypothetical protein